jgi:hypothetical protein
MSLLATELFDSVQRRPTELAWIWACSPESTRHMDLCGVAGENVAGQTVLAVERCLLSGRLKKVQLDVLIKHGRTGRPGRKCALARRIWDRAIDILEDEMKQTVFPPPQPLDRPALPWFYGVGGTPFVDAANAWWWALDCLDARAEGARGTSSLRKGRPCEPDDVVNALRRLDLPAPHARVVVAWGKQRTEPPAGSEARRRWDEVMARLTVVLRVKGIVRQSEEVRRAARTLELMDVPLTGLRPLDCVPARPDDSAGHPGKRRADGLDAALEKLGAAVADRVAVGA